MASSSIQSYLGKRDYSHYVAGSKRARGSSGYAYGRKRVYAPRMPMPVRSSGPYPAQLRVLGPEKKSVDIPNAVYTLNTTPSFTTINLIRVGSTFCNRIGRKIEMKSLKLDFAIQPLRTVAAPDYVRVLVVYDRQTNGAVPAVADILQDTDQATANTTNAFSHANVNNVDRFQILRDHRFILPSATITAGVATNPGFMDPATKTLYLQDYIKLKGLTTQYKADSAPAVIGDIATGALYFLCFGGIAAGTEGWQITGNIRLRFCDS